MTATEVLRRMLDERGVEHYDGTETTLWLKDGVGYRASADEGLSGFMHLHLWCTTPEQAIAATLGPGTCEADETDVIKCWVKCKDEPSVEHMELIHAMECSECGHTYEHVNGDYEFCPRCGRKRADG